MKAQRNNQRGFTLLEMLVAFVVFAIALSALMGIASDSLSAARRSADFTQAALWAQTKLDAVGIEEPLEEGSDGGKFDERFRWELAVTKEEPPASIDGVLEEIPINLYRVELTVLWGERTHERRAIFKTLRAITPDANSG